MSADNVGGAAFPTPKDNLYLGMTLRDYMAAKAMQAHVTAQWAQHYATKPNEDVNNHWDDEGISMCAYDMADAMLKAREVTA